MAISSCCKLVALGLVSDLCVYRIFDKPSCLVITKKITNTHAGRTITDIFFFNEDKRQAIFSISYGFDYKVIHLENHVFNEAYSLEDSTANEEGKGQRATNIQVACLTNRKFYLIQNNELKVESR